MLRVDNEVSSFYGTQARGVGQLGDVSGDASRPVAVISLVAEPAARLLLKIDV